MRHLHTQCADDPHPCFGCKLHYWREHGMNLLVPQEWSSGPTVREQRNELYEGARRDGRDISRA